MGFEQLASLKEQLAQQARAEKQQKQKPREAKKPAQPVDPIVPVIGQLQKQFPKAFPKNPAPKLPLKLGIHRDLLERSEQLGISKKVLREAIKTWCWGNRYWAAVVEDAVRVDLEGAEAGKVTKAEAEQSKSLAARRLKKPAVESD